MLGGGGITERKMINLAAGCCRGDGRQSLWLTVVTH